MHCFNSGGENENNERDSRSALYSPRLSFEGKNIHGIVDTDGGEGANGVACRCPCLTSNDTANVPRTPPQITKFPLSQTYDINRARGKKLNFEVIEAQSPMSLKFVASETCLDMHLL